MPRSGCSALHGVNTNELKKKKKKNRKSLAFNLSLIYYSKVCSHFSILSIVKIGWKPEDVVLVKKSKKDVKNVEHMMINHDIATVGEFMFYT